MIAEAQIRSGTFRRLIEAIESTDGIVYVEEGDCHHGVSACVPRVITSVEGFRILWVLVDARLKDWQVMSDIGHELQHTLELLGERRLRTNGQAFFFLQPPNGVKEVIETEEAIQVGNAVKNEIEAFARSKSTKGQSR
jgi:hypothetical protein